MNKNNYLKIYFPSLPCNNDVATCAAVAFVEPFNLPECKVNDIKTAVSEAVTNCIVHAYPEDAGRVHVRMHVTKNGVLYITVKDWGNGIQDVEQAMRPLYTTDGEERSGMGFTIMSAFADKVKVTSSPQNGTTVKMSFKLNEEK